MKCVSVYLRLKKDIFGFGLEAGVSSPSTSVVSPFCDCESTKYGNRQVQEVE